MERIPVLEERLANLTQRIIDIHEENKQDLQELKTEHVNDIRKNICRLWMAFDELRIAVTKICTSMEKMSGIDEGRWQIARVVWILAGASAGAMVTALTRHWWNG